MPHSEQRVGVSGMLHPASWRAFTLVDFQCTLSFKEQLITMELPVMHIVNVIQCDALIKRRRSNKWQCVFFTIAPLRRICETRIKRLQMTWHFCYQCSNWLQALICAHRAGSFTLASASPRARNTHTHTRWRGSVVIGPVVLLALVEGYSLWKEGCEEERRSGGKRGTRWMSVDSK